MPSQTPFSNIIDFQFLKGKQILEIGCGMGSHAELFARNGRIVTAIDITEKAVRCTYKRFNLQRLDGAILKMDAAKMNFLDESFDFIWSWGVIHYAEDTEAIIKEIYRVLKPGGKAQIMVYHKNSLRYYVYGCLREGIIHGKLLKNSLYEINMSFTDGALAHHYTKKEAKKMFAKFSLINTSILDGNQEAYIPVIGKLLRRFSPAIMKNIDRRLLIRFGWFLLIKVTK